MPTWKLEVETVFVQTSCRTAEEVAAGWIRGALATLEPKTWLVKSQAPAWAYASQASTAAWAYASSAAEWA